VKEKKEEILEVSVLRSKLILSNLRAWSRNRQHERRNKINGKEKKIQEEKDGERED